MDLNVMMREQAVAGLELQLDAAVTDGDTVKARKISGDLAALKMSTAPKAPPFGDAEIRAELDKQTWFGTDPKRSAKAVEFGKTMDPKKFATAELFAAAIVKAVDDEFKPAPAAADEGETDEEREARGAAEDGKKPRRTDGPNESDNNQRSVRRSTSGPWTKIADAPSDIQKEIKRQADKFVPASAPKEQREKFITNALQSHYAIHQRKTEKK